MSGDDILMDYHSCLGPIDPQLELDDRLVPALSYLSQYENLIEKSRNETLSTAELVLLQKLDLAELHQFELARDLSIALMKGWLTRYKFKDWIVTETQGETVTEEMKEERAASDFGDDSDLKKAVWDYFWFLRDHMARNGLVSFVHNPYFF